MAGAGFELISIEQNGRAQTAAYGNMAGVQLHPAVQGQGCGDGERDDHEQHEWSETAPEADADGSGSDGEDECLESAADDDEGLTGGCGHDPADRALVCSRKLRAAG